MIIFVQNKAAHYYIFNHVDITILYHPGDGETWEGSRLVQARIEPRSLDSSECDTSAAPLAIPKILDKAEIKIPYTYSVKFQANSNIKWASRWDYASFQTILKNFFIKFFNFF